MYTCAYCKKPTKMAPTLIVGDDQRVYPPCCFDCATGEEDLWQSVPLALATPDDVEQAIAYNLEYSPDTRGLKQLETLG